MKKLLIVVLLSFLAFPCLAATRYKILSTKDISVVSGNVGIGTTAPGKLFAVDGAVYMKGNVGIGTTNPAAGLEVIKNSSDSTPAVKITQQSAWVPNFPYALQVVGYSDLGGLRINIADGTNSLFGGYNLMGFSVKPGYRITFGDSSGANSEVLNIINGKVGIGTTAPAQLLAVDGAVYMKGNVGIGTTSPVGLLQIAGTGNVGIGTTTTPGRLSVDGSIYQKGTDCSTACWVNGFAGCKDTGTCVAR
jgi:hypothetical protein